jgi:hypothetical protein
MIKAPRNAEWKVHGWEPGKPPIIEYEGIGFGPSKDLAPANVTLPDSSSTGYIPPTARGIEITPPSAAPPANQSAQPSMSPKGDQDEVKLMVPRPFTGGIPRASMSGWSDYDDLAVFEGKFNNKTQDINRFFGKLKAPALPSNSSPVANSTTVDSNNAYPLTISVAAPNRCPTWPPTPRISQAQRPQGPLGHQPQPGCVQWVFSSF